MPRLSLLLAFAGLAAPTASLAATVRSDGAIRTLDCAGEQAAVDGSRNEVTFTGGCRSLSVRGDGNVVTIELAPGAGLDVRGNANRIRYTLGAAPPIAVSGSETELQRLDAPPPPPPPITLAGDAHALDLDCTGRDVVIHGNRSRYVLRGGCRSLAASGAGNHIEAELLAGARAVVDGNGTSFAYSVLGGGEADVTVRGARSRAQREVAAASAVGALQPPVVPAPLADRAVPPSPMVATATDDTVPLPSAPAPQIVAATPELSAPPASGTADAGPVAAGTPRLPALLHLLGARVVTDGTSVAVPMDEVFQPGSDTMRSGADARLRQIVQLADLIHPSMTRLAIADPADTALATQRAEALGAWFSSQGLAVREADVFTGATVSAVDVLLAR